MLRPTVFGLAMIAAVASAGRTIAPSSRSSRGPGACASAISSPNFEKSSGIQVEATYQASAALTTQIQNGAPFDLFLSADMGYPKRLISDGLADAAGSADSSTPINYARRHVWSCGRARIRHCLHRRWICLRQSRASATRRRESRSRALRTGGGRGTHQPQTLRCSSSAAGDG